MRPVEKINLIKNLTNVLSSYNLKAHIEFLKYCKIAYEVSSWNQDQWIDLDDALYAAGVTNLIMLAQELEISTNLATLTKHYPRNWESDVNLKAFISHSVVNKASAHRLKEALKLHKISGFVAHDDVEPSLSWQDEIEKALNTMDVFVSIHTANFEQSIWCQQELGFAIARNVDIVPIKTKKEKEEFLPKGFAGRTQAIQSMEVSELARKISDIVRSSKKIGELYNKINPINDNNYNDDIPF